MSNIKIELEIPEEILINLKQSSEEFKNELKLLMAIELYKKKRLSLGKAAMLGGFTKIGFIDVLNFRGEPVFNYTDDEIEAEIQNIHRSSQKRPLAIYCVCGSTLSNFMEPFLGSPAMKTVL